MASQKQSAHSWTASLAVLLLFASLLLYSLVHRPFCPELVVSLAKAIWGFLITLFLVALGGGFIARDSEHFHLLDLASLEAILADLPLLRDYKGDYSLYSLSQ